MKTCHGTPTRQDSQTWKSGENISTLTKRTRTSDPCDACLLSSAVIFSCVGFSQRQPPMNSFCLRSIPTQNLKRKAGMASAPPIFRVRANRRIWRRGPLPPPSRQNERHPEKRGGPLPPFSDPEERHPKSKEGLCPPFPERDKKRKSKHIIF